MEPRRRPSTRASTLSRLEGGGEGARSIQLIRRVDVHEYNRGVAEARDLGFRDGQHPPLVEEADALEPARAEPPLDGPETGLGVAGVEWHPLPGDLRDDH